jgi:hypothetical protein
MLEKELNKLKEYINKNIKKEFIRLSKLLAEFLVILYLNLIGNYNYV